MVGIAGQRLAAGRLGFGEPAKIGEQGRPVGQCPGVIGLDRQGAVQNRAGLLIAKGMEQEAAQRREIVCAFGLKGRHTPEGDDRLVVPARLEQGARGLAPRLRIVRATAYPGSGGVFQARPVATFLGIGAGEGASAVLKSLELGCQGRVQARGLRQRALGLVPASLGGQRLAAPREGLGVVRQLAGPPGWTACTSEAASGAA